MAWVTLCEMGELTEGRGKAVSVDGFRLAVFLDRGTAGVIDDACPHAGASLSRGTVEDGCAVCPSHHWAFDLTTGRLRDSAAVSVDRYPVRVMNHNGTRFVQAELPSV